MFTPIKNLWNHRLVVSVALTETGAVQTLRLRTAWLGAVALFTLSGWLALALAGDIGRARLAALTGDTQATHYIGLIDDLKRQRDAEREQVKVIAKELGTLQLRLARFDALGNKLQAEGTIIADAPEEGSDSIEPAAGPAMPAPGLGKTAQIEPSNGPNGKGGPLADSPMGEPIFDISEVRAQLGLINQRADFAELALETSLAMSIRKALGPANSTLPFFFPVMSETFRLSSSFGWRADPIHRTRAFHAGFDVADRVGSPVVAAGEGVVVYAGWRFGYGNLIEIKHTNGFSTRYGHLHKTIAKEGQRVSPGTLVGLLGNTGRSTGPHLHFEVRKDDKPLNGYPFVKDTRMEVMQMARNGKGKELLAAWKAEGKKTASR